MPKSVLVDTTKCIGCRACQVSCKRWNDQPAEKTEFFAKPGGYQNPASLSAKTYTLIEFNEIKQGNKLKWVFAKRQCMHCQEPACVSACLVKAIQKKPNGEVVYDASLCMGCRYCMIACPFDTPKFEYDKAIPRIRKCTLCFDRQAHGYVPSCAKACTTGALKFGDREEVLETARTRIYQNPDKYVHHIYGEHEVGGTNYLYISDVPFEKLGFRTNLGTTPYPTFTKVFLSSVPLVIIGGAALFSGFHWFVKRREQLSAEKKEV